MEIRRAMLIGYSRLAWNRLPLAIRVCTFSNKPHYYMNATSDPLFWPLVGVALGLELVGVYIMYKLVNFRV